ncbi:MAG: hypothetical protein GY846_19195 [Deltaproteobacteria bacterium]|nr:hypothetical protein [Deltaproteobacteria bacterium]
MNTGIIVDTCIRIEFFRLRGSKDTHRLKHLLVPSQSVGTRGTALSIMRITAAFFILLTPLRSSYIVELVYLMNRIGE